MHAVSVNRFFSDAGKYVPAKECVCVCMCADEIPSQIVRWHQHLWLYDLYHLLVCVSLCVCVWYLCMLVLVLVCMYPVTLFCSISLTCVWKKKLTTRKTVISFDWRQTIFLCRKYKWISNFLRLCLLSVSSVCLLILKL